MRFEEIVAISDSLNLLDGRLVIYTLAGPAITIGYNGASRQVVAQLVHLLRELATDPLGETPRLAPPHPFTADTPGLDQGDLGDCDVALVTFSREVVRSEPGLRLESAHGRIVLTPRGGAATRLVHLARPMTLHGAIVCSDEHTRVILGRRQWLVRGNRTEHSLTYLTVSSALLDATTVQDHPRYLGVHVVTLHLGDARLEVPVPAGSGTERALHL